MSTSWHVARAQEFERPFFSSLYKFHEVPSSRCGPRRPLLIPAEYEVFALTTHRSALGSWHSAPRVATSFCGSSGHWWKVPFRGRTERVGRLAFTVVHSRGNAPEVALNFRDTEKSVTPHLEALATLASVKTFHGETRAAEDLDPGCPNLL